MLLDSFEHAEDDVRTRQLAEQRVEAERILQAAQAAMAASPELLTDDDRSRIDAAVRVARDSEGRQRSRGHPRRRRGAGRGVEGLRRPPHESRPRRGPARPRRRRPSRQRSKNQRRQAISPAA